MATLIRNGRIVTAVDDYAADILVDDGRIRTIGRQIAVGGDVEVHDAGGLLVLPGGVDVHTHLDYPDRAYSTPSAPAPRRRRSAARRRWSTSARRWRARAC
jgi:dihydroorotase-like cyclic amidohydrolase